MTKENVVYGLAGVVVGIIIGALIFSYSTGPRYAVPPGNVQASVSEPDGNTVPKGQLPEGHPPISEALRPEIEAQQRILSKDPNNQTALVTLANLNFDMKNFQEAAPYYEKAIRKDPTNVGLITDLGTCFLSLNQTDKAIEYYSKSLAIEPNHYQTLMNMGIARMNQGDKDGAAQAWEKLVTLYPNTPNVQMVKDAITRLRGQEKGS